MAISFCLSVRLSVRLSPVNVMSFATWQHLAAYRIDSDTLVFFLLILHLVHNKMVHPIETPGNHVNYGSECLEPEWFPKHWLLLSIDRGSTASRGGGQLTPLIPLFRVGVKEWCLIRTFWMHKSSFTVLFVSRTLLRYVWLLSMSSQFRLSSVCLSVCNVGAPYSEG